MASDKVYPIPCVSLIFRNEDGKFLVLKRISDFDNDVWCAPGGKVDFGETLDTAIKRECKEEVGLEILDYMFGCPFDRISQGKHYVIMPVLVYKYKGKPVNMEPHKSSDLQWLTLEQMCPLADRWYETFELCDYWNMISYEHMDNE